VVLIVTERSRPAHAQSAAWIARQAGKIPVALDELVLGGNEDFTPHGFGLAEIADARSAISICAIPSSAGGGAILGCHLRKFRSDKNVVCP
jgi:hypothetical protein